MSSLSKLRGEPVVYRGDQLNSNSPNTPRVWFKLLSTCRIHKGYDSP